MVFLGLLVEILFTLLLFTILRNVAACVVDILIDCSVFLLTIFGSKVKMLFILTKCFLHFRLVFSR